ncbi:MAG: hypothetical protein IJR87_05755 [Bacteroidaceae bacterium]|nr:hypothetical protein [Bacteroidaceae bacterium]
MRNLFSLLTGLLLACTVAQAAREGAFLSTLQGTGTPLPPRYVMPLLSNGCLSIHFDMQGTQKLANYRQPSDGILWQGRRMGPPNDALFSFGHYKQEITYGGATYLTPKEWTQTLDTRKAEMVCQNTYGPSLAVKTEIFVHATENIVAIRKTFQATGPLPGSVTYRFRYDLSSSSDGFQMPRRMNFMPRWEPERQTLDIRYTAVGSRDFEGIISMMADRSVKPDESLENLSIEVEVKPQEGKEDTVTFFLLYVDNLESGNYTSLLTSRQERARNEGFEGLHESHRQTWAKYWSKSHIDLPDEQLERAYIGGLYQLFSNATPWSFPVGIGLWSGRYFAFDETYCYLGLASSNHLDVARRAPEFRRKYLERACGRTLGTGARYPWETTEDGLEGAPQPYGHWYDHVFHMSHIATMAWTHYLYTNDSTYLRDVAFPIMRECSRFFMRHMCYHHPDGSVTFGKTTDLERLGAALENPFFSSCGAIYTFESTVRAAALLGLQDSLYVQYAQLAEGLRKTLPHNGQRYVAYSGCTENSIATVAGMFPYPVLSTDDPLEEAAVLHFYEARYQAGNMYAVGSGLCPWYASWMASAMAAYGHRDKSLGLLREAAAQVGYFTEHFEINEKDVISNPWFTTAAGNYVHALDQTLLFCRQDDVFMCHAAPEEWTDYAFTLPAYGNLLVTAEVKGGRLRQCQISPGQWSTGGGPKTVWIPDRMLSEKHLTREARRIMTHTDGYYQFSVSLSAGDTLQLVR